MYTVYDLITISPLVVCLEIILPIRRLKNVTLPIYGKFRLFSVIHLC